MSDNLVIYLIIAVAILLLISYAVAIYVKKRNESKLAILEEKNAFDWAESSGLP